MAWGIQVKNLNAWFGKKQALLAHQHVGSGQSLHRRDRATPVCGNPHSLALHQSHATRRFQRPGRGQHHDWRSRCYTATSLHATPPPRGAWCFKSRTHFHHVCVRQRCVGPQAQWLQRQQTIRRDRRAIASRTRIMDEVKDDLKKEVRRELIRGPAAEALHRPRSCVDPKYSSWTNPVRRSTHFHQQK